MAWLCAIPNLFIHISTDHLISPFSTKIWVKYWYTCILNNNIPIFLWVLTCGGVFLSSLDRYCALLKTLAFWLLLAPLATFGYFWLLLATFGYFWLLLATFGYFWLPLATFGYLWLILATFGYFWLPDNLTTWQELLAFVGSCWELLAVFAFRHFGQHFLKLQKGQHSQYSLYILLTTKYYK